LPFADPVTKPTNLAPIEFALTGWPREDEPLLSVVSREIPTGAGGISDSLTSVSEVSISPK